ncbi:MAG: hypothetical protein WAW37_17685 [Syntrophobacteraceae bacterium]
MRFFDWIDFQFEMIALFLGLVSLIMVYLAWASYPWRSRAGTPEEMDDQATHEMLTGHDTEKNPIAPFLIFTYIGIALCWVSYVIYYWASAGNF